MAGSSTVFRVSGLPAGINEHEALAKLKCSLLESGEASREELQKICKFTVVPSCVDDTQSCALLDWKG